MKKLLLAVLTTALMAIGLVGVSSTAANAACTPTRYQACSNTTTTVLVDRDASGVPTGFVIAVNTVSNVKPTGTVTIQVSTPRKFRKKGKAPLPAQLLTFTATYTGNTITLPATIAKNRPGTYTVVTRFDSTTPSAFNGSTSVTSFEVEKEQKAKKNKNKKKNKKN